ncbi:hypothetical protein AAJ76_1700016143 [Vairimorpha ceranae]|uniref:Uncharacterized protein n=1 Tax=Vairimorpha ceranae TaxID=40302 RepID=A0A0F9WDR4_9MICR|nr:hypothetical protein AAJ76_1700016143 [Vairimorpha ceranae]KKO75571.1 hypothetical protein AAJ76_1700016143 [Vairimorpha ceranae]
MTSTIKKPRLWRIRKNKRVSLKAKKCLETCMSKFNCRVFARNCACGKKAFDDAIRPVNFRVKGVFVTISLICRNAASIRTILTR